MTLCLPLKPTPALSTRKCLEMAANPKFAAIELHVRFWRKADVGRSPLLPAADIQTETLPRQQTARPLCMTAPAPTEPPDEWGAATDEAIAVCSGDARTAVRALPVAYAYLEQELAMAVPAVGRGSAEGGIA